MNYVLLVCGFGRCGTSLVMQMLEAAGVSCSGQYPGFEDTRASVFEFDAQWVAAQRGHAVKVIDPHIPEITFAPGDYRTIWLDRNHKQQARSQVKFLRLMSGFPADQQTERAFAKSYGRDRPAALDKLREIGPVHRLTFEQIINHPWSSADALCTFFGLGYDNLVQMAGVVRARSTAATPDMDIEVDLLRKRNARA